MSPKAKQDLIIAAFIYAVVGALFAVTTTMLPDSALFPRMILALIAVINTVSAIKVVLNDRKLRAAGTEEESMLPFKTAKMPLLLFLGAAVYVAVFALTNYFIATALMLVVFMLIEKVKPWWLIPVITAVYLGFIYYLFVVQLSVRLIR